MWQVVINTVLRKLNSFVFERSTSKAETPTMRVTGHRLSSNEESTDKSYPSEDDSGFADDEGLRRPCRCTSSLSGRQILNYSESEEECSENENDFVLDADVKRRQKMTLMSLLYSRALDKKISQSRRKKPSYATDNAEYYQYVKPISD